MRPFVAAIAIFAIAIASCYAPRLAQVSAHAMAATAQPHVDEHDHAAARPCDNRSLPDSDPVGGEQSRYCCAAACAATSFILPEIALLVPLAAAPVAAIPVESLRQMPTEAIDPPPRAA